MKKNVHLLALVFLLLGGFVSLPAGRAQAQATVSFQVFYDQLSPYGTWISYPSYGYVWLPTQVPQGFRPYGTGGHWVYTDQGWAWVSDYDWGWAPFHYGNWFYDQYYGWMWLPDYEWAPAWVTWGDYGGNYCWAPIAPGISFGISYRPPIYCWTFVPHGYITNVNVSRYYVSHINNTTIVNNITVINNVNTVGGHGYVRGPQPQSVERFTHTTIRPVAIRAALSPGAGHLQGGQLAMYRPTISRPAGAAAARPAPAHLQDYHSLRQGALPSVNSHISQQTFTANHTSSPLRPENRGLARTTSAPVTHTNPPAHSNPPATRTNHVPRTRNNQVNRNPPAQHNAPTNRTTTTHQTTHTVTSPPHHAQPRQQVQQRPAVNRPAPHPSNPPQKDHR